MACMVIHAGQLTDSFMVKTGVRRGCLLSPFLFLLAIDWIMKKTTINRRNGIQWTPWSQLEDLALLSKSINRCRKKHSCKHSVNTARTQHQQQQDKDYESQHKEQQPHYIERRATGRDRLIHIPGQYSKQNGGTEEDVKARIQKARVAFIMLRKIWKAKQIKTNTKLSELKKFQ